MATKVVVSLTKNDVVIAESYFDPELAGLIDRTIAEYHKHAITSIFEDSNGCINMGLNKVVYNYVNISLCIYNPNDGDYDRVFSCIPTLDNLRKLMEAAKALNFE